MAGSQVTISQNQIDKQRLGYCAISLTNYDATTEPQVAAGSKAESGGALFEFTALESITGWGGIGASNDVYVKLVVSGTAVTAVFTTAAPTWDTAKQGWYAALDRYVAKLYKDAGGNYTLKRMLSIPQQKGTAEGVIATGVRETGLAAAALKCKVIEIGDWNMDSTDTVTVAHGLSDKTKIRDVRVVIRPDSDSVTYLHYYHLEIMGIAAPFTPIPAGFAAWDNTNVLLRRTISGPYDGTDWNATSYNRGWITVWYEA